MLDQLHLSTKSIDCGAPNGNRRYCTISHDGVFRICTELKKVITPIKVKLKKKDRTFISLWLLPHKWKSLWA